MPTISTKKFIALRKLTRSLAETLINLGARPIQNTLGRT